MTSRRGDAIAFDTRVFRRALLLQFGRALRSQLSAFENALDAGVDTSISAALTAMADTAAAAAQLVRPTDHNPQEQTDE